MNPQKRVRRRLRGKGEVSVGRGGLVRGVRKAQREVERKVGTKLVKNERKSKAEGGWERGRWGKKGVLLRSVKAFGNKQKKSEER